MTRSRVLFLLVFLLSATSFTVNRIAHVNILGGGDEGSYIGAGKLFSEHLSFVFPDPVLAKGKQYAPASTFLPSSFRLADESADPPTVQTGWNKGFPIVSAPFWWLDPESGWKYVSPLAGALSLLLLYAIGTRLGGASVGAYAALFLATNTLQLWFSRYPMTEVLSQCLQLALLWCTVVFLQEGRKRVLWIFTTVGALSLLVHFGNAPTFAILAGFLCFEAFNRSERSIGAAFVTGLRVATVPLITVVGYWFLDPGIHRYERLGKVMVRNSSDTVEVFLHALTLRLNNLLCFVSPPLLLLLGVGLVLALVKKRLEPRFWVLLTLLMGLSVVVIATAGIGVPRVMYVGRRNLPIVLPIIMLVAAFGLDLLRGDNGDRAAPHARRGRGAFLHIIALLIASLQLVAFLPFHSLNPGEGLPAVGRRLRAELAKRDQGGEQFVVIPTRDVARHMHEGLRYIYGLPILPYEEDGSTDETLRLMVQRGVQLYAIEVLDRTSLMKVQAGFSKIPGTRLRFITIINVQWGHPNSSEPTVPPQVSDKAKYQFALYRVERDITARATP